MRIFAFLLVCLSITAVAYRQEETISPQAPAIAACVSRQTTNILFQSTDGGKTWQDFSRGLPEKLEVNSVFAENGEVFLGTDNGTVYHSRNPQTGLWELETVGGAFPEYGAFPDNRNTVTNSAQSTQDSTFGGNRNIVTGLFPGRSGLYACVYKGGFFRRNAGTNQWEPMHGTLGENTIHAVVENPDGIIFVGCDNGIYKSADNCKTWKRTYTEGGVGSLVAANGVLIGSGNKGLVRSTDGGENWTCVLPHDGSAYSANLIKGRLPSVPDRFAVACIATPWRTSAEGVQLLRTSSDGKTWQRTAEVVPSAPTIFNLTQAGEYVFCSHEKGISRSSDWGETWQPIHAPAELEDMYRFELAGFGQTVFAVIVWGGC